MFFLIIKINKNFIKENKNKLSQIPTEDTTHKAHKLVGAFVRPNCTTTNS